MEYLRLWGILSFITGIALSQLEKVPSKQRGTSKCLQFKTKKHLKGYSV